MTLSDEKVPALQAMLVGVVDKLPYGILMLKVSGQFQHLLEVFHLLTVIIRIGEGKLQDQSTHGCLLIIRGHADRVFRYEDVGCNATAAVNHTANARMIGRPRVLDAVTGEILTMLITLDQILESIILIITIDIGLLDATADGV